MAGKSVRVSTIFKAGLAAAGLLAGSGLGLLAAAELSVKQSMLQFHSQVASMRTRIDTLASPDGSGSGSAPRTPATPAGAAAAESVH